MPLPPRRPVLRAALSTVAGLVVVGTLLAVGPSSAVTTDDPLAALPADAPSTRVAEQTAELTTPPTVPAVAVYSRDDGGSL